MLQKVLAILVQFQSRRQDYLVTKKIYFFISEWALQGWEGRLSLLGKHQEILQELVLQELHGAQVQKVL